MAYVVTGASGFIGSNLVRALNERGISEIIAVDNLQRSGKFTNLVGLKIADYLDKQEFLDRLVDGQFDGALEAIFHQGACSDTMESDGRYMMENNYRYSIELLEHCIEQEVRLLYASSAAVYGGAGAFRESPSCEKPLNVYGYSKLLFDEVVRRRLAEDAGTQIAGFRYFNVYGPNEAHKGRMASVAYHFFNQYRMDGFVRPFAGSGGYADGDQRRDFVSVEDVVKVNLHFFDHPEISGIFNCGTGIAQSFNDVAVAVLNACRETEGLDRRDLGALHRDGLIRYSPFPDQLLGKYQHFTQADSSQLRSAGGYKADFLRVEEGVGRYVKYLLSGVNTLPAGRVA